MRLTDGIALLAALFAALMSADSMAASLVGSGAPHLARTIRGVEVFRFLLLVHACALYLIPRAQWLRTASLVPRAATQPDDVSDSVWRTSLIAIIVLAAALRFVHLGTGLWYDEIEALQRYARPSIGQIVTTFDSQNQHMLYSLSAHEAIRMFGDGAWALRLPALVYGVLGLWALARLGALFTSRREALLATLLLAVSYHHVWFSQDARGYSALLLCTIVGTGLFARMLEREASGGIELATGYAVVMALGLYTHLTAAFVLAAHGLIWLAAAWRSRTRIAEGGTYLPLLAMTLAGSIAMLLYAFVLPQAFGTTSAPTMQNSGVAWQRPGWFVAEALRGLGAGVPGGFVTLILGVFVTGVGVAGYWKRSPWRTALMIVPGIVTAVALAATAHNLWPRFFFFLAGFAVLIVVRGGFVIAERVLPVQGTRAASLVTVMVAIASLVTVPRAWLPKQDFDGARAWIERTRAAGDAVVVVDMTRLPYQRYLRGAWQMVDSEADLAAVEKSHRRTWVAYTFPARLEVVQPGIWRRLQQDYRPATEFPSTVGGGAIVIKVRG